MDLDCSFLSSPGLCGVPYSSSYCVFPIVREALRGGLMQSSPYERPAQTWSPNGYTALPITWCTVILNKRNRGMLLRQINQSENTCFPFRRDPKDQPQVNPVPSRQSHVCHPEMATELCFFQNSTRWPWRVMHPTTLTVSILPCGFGSCLFMVNVFQFPGFKGASWRMPTLAHPLLLRVTGSPESLGPGAHRFHLSLAWNHPSSLPAANGQRWLHAVWTSQNSMREWIWTRVWMCAYGGQR